MVNNISNFHSCFGHLDGIGANIRAGTQSFPLPDAHIRFERATEVRPKTSENVEEVFIVVIARIINNSFLFWLSSVTREIFHSI